MNASQKHDLASVRIQRNAWVAILSDVLQVDVASKLDSIDIVWTDLNWALEGMEDRQILALQSRYEHKLTLEGAGRVIGHKDGSGPLSREIARQVINRALQTLRHPNRLRVIRAAITAAWNLNSKLLTHGPKSQQIQEKSRIRNEV